MRPIRDTQKEWNHAVSELLDQQDLGSRPNSIADRQRVKRIKKLLSRSRTGRKLLAWAKRNEVEIWLDHQISDDYAGFVFSGTNTVILNAGCSNIFLATILAHELMHVWQDHQNLLPVKFDNPSHFIISQRLCEASAYSVQSQVIEELEQAHIRCRQKMIDAYGGDGLLYFNSTAGHYDDIAAKTFRLYMGSNIQQNNDETYKNIILNSVFEKRAPFHKISTFASSHLKYNFDKTRPVVKPKINLNWVLKYGKLPCGENIWIKNGAPTIKQKDIWPYFIVTPTPLNPIIKSALESRREQDKKSGKKPVIILTPFQ